MSLTKPQRHQSKKLRDSARGQDCLIRSPKCNGDPETTVLCHLGGGGMATKQSDYKAAFGCSSCHDLVDGRTGHEYSPHFVTQIHQEGALRTLDYWYDNGILKL